MTGPRTLYAKIFDAHVVARRDDGTCLIYIDRHLVHEVSSPQAFEGLRNNGRGVRRPDLTLAVADHNVPTSARRDAAGAPLPLGDAESVVQLAALADNVAAHGIAYLDALDPRQGIVHVVGPELGFTLPGTTLVCGDSHTTAHGALGALALGIGTSEVEHVLATQTLWLRPSPTMEIRLAGELGVGVTAKDVILHVIGRIGVAGATGHVVEYTGSAVRAMTIEQRLTIANMSIEAGARAGLIAPDEITFTYLAGRPMAPSGAAWDAALAAWRLLATDPGATYDRSITIDVGDVAPCVTWGSTPQDVAPITGRVPDPAAIADPAQQVAVARAVEQMALTPGMAMQGIAIDHVFIGSCTNARIDDLRAAAAVLRGRHIAPGIRRAIVVPGSGAVKRQAEGEGLDAIFRAAGFEWREPGCSMCVGLNEDRVPPGGRCASTSNRNFPGRQGPGSRTHLMSPPMAAAAAIAGHLADVRQLGVLPG